MVSELGAPQFAIAGNHDLADRSPPHSVERITPRRVRGASSGWTRPSRTRSRAASTPAPRSIESMHSTADRPSSPSTIRPARTAPTPGSCSTEPRRWSRVWRIAPTSSRSSADTSTRRSTSPVRASCDCWERHRRSSRSATRRRVRDRRCRSDRRPSAAPPRRRVAHDRTDRGLIRDPPIAMAGQRHGGQALDMPITPDTKSWTWVLERACPDCGFDASATDPTSVSADSR